MREGQDKATLMEQYKELQEQVISWGEDVMPGYVSLGVWRRRRVDGYYDSGNAFRLLRQGRLPGAIKVGDTWMVPEHAQPMPSPNAKYDPYQERVTSRDGVKL